MREMICWVLATVLFGTTMMEARADAVLAVSFGRPGTEAPLTVQERLLQVPPGTMIEVRLKNRQKIRGRLGEFNNDGFNLTTVQGQKIVKEKIAYTDLKTFKKVDGHKVGHAIVYALAGVGVFMVIMIIWAATQLE